MGIQISDIIPRKEITLKELNGKILAVDAMNTLYQFLTTIRQADGTPLMDKHQRISSHISGLFYRNINLLQEGIKLVYVFDGKPPELKFQEIGRRIEAKEIAKEKYEKAKSDEDVDSMRKYSQQFVKMTPEIIEESKELLEAMGIPVIQANGEGEAEASLLARNGKAWASASQDYDSLLYGTPRLIRNLTLSRKRKTSSGAYVEINIELVEFEYLLNHLQINKDQLICLGILVGTDYNPGGIKGIGQKTALDIVRKYQYPVKIFEYVKTNPKYEINFDWQEIYKIFHEHESSTTKEIIFNKPDTEKIKKILLSRDFSEERINSGLEKLNTLLEKAKQKTLF
ncbi:MAG: flap endonuclease-1 [Nanoarchaeota archaeon]|nr:flap endonuclease-1 [Nanoarchaeota archaeon]